MQLIGMASQAQHGKDTLADYLRDALNKQVGYEKWYRSALAKNVKKIFKDVFAKDDAYVEKHKVLLEAPGDLDMPVRGALQFIGDGFRKIKGTIWLDLMRRQLEETGNPATIISDVRYINELRWIKNLGGINILVARPDKLNNDPNGSEAQIRPLVEWAIKGGEDLNMHIVKCIVGPVEAANLLDYVIINNGSMQDLYGKADRLLIPFINETFKE